MWNNTDDYFYNREHYKNYSTNYINTENNYEKYWKNQEIDKNIFSPNMNNLNVLELSSLNNTFNFKSQNGIEVTKLTQTSNKNVITLNSGKKILILDLDETLVHSSTKSPFPNKKNIILNMNLKNMKYKIYVIIRPFFEKFLEEMSLYYDLYIFTASMPHYSKSLIKILDKNKVIIQVLNKEHCLNIKGLPFKDLSIFNKDLKDIIIIDNNPISYALNKNNGIPISTWIDNPNDKELLKLISILKYLSKVKDVRPIINKIKYKFKEKINFSKVNEILKNDNNLKLIGKHNNIKDIDDLQNFKDNSIKSYKKMKIDEINNNSNEQNHIKNQSIDINKRENVNKNKSGFNKSKINKININKKLKLKINTTNIFPNKTSKISINKISSPKLTKEPKIYNITIENISNVQNKINIFKTIDINESEKEPTNSNQNIKLSEDEINNKNNVNNNPIALSAHKTNNKNKFGKLLTTNKYKIIKKKINLNKVVNKKVKNKSIEKEEIDKGPIDNEKINIKKHIKSSIKNEIFLENERDLNPLQTENENQNNDENKFINIIEKNQEISKSKTFNNKNIVFNFTKKIQKNKNLTRFNEDNQQIKRDKIVIMKILSNPNKKKESDKLFNNIYDDLI